MSGSNKFLLQCVKHRPTLSQRGITNYHMTQYITTVPDCQGLLDGIDMIPSDLTSQLKVQHEDIVWSNFLVNAPIVYSLLERRMLYYLTLYVKHRFTEKNLGVPESWKELYFEMSDDDLGKVGGRTNVLQTYEALSEIGKKFIPISFMNQNGHHISGKVHWVDTFFYNAETKKYIVRMSPEIMPYLINLSKSFTAFDVGTAMMLSSKFCQKFYELCCQFSGDVRFHDAAGNKLKKNVIPLDINYFRRLFNLEEVKDSRTGKVVTQGKYINFKDLRKRVIEPSQVELNELYLTGHSNVWFDYCENKEGRKVTMIYLFIYTKINPKKESLSPWKKGDEPLCPYETEYIRPKKSKDKIKESRFYDCTTEQLEIILETVLNRYLKKEETWYYLHYIKNSKYYCKDSYLQVMQVIKDKEQQPKFSSSTLAYKRKCIKQFALKENLKEFGWSINPPPKNIHLEQKLPGLF